MSQRIHTPIYLGALPNMLPVAPYAPTLYPERSSFSQHTPPLRPLREPKRVTHSLLTRPLTPTTTALEDALNAVDAEKIKTDLFYVAADERGGRGTPSKGQSETADYIEKRVREFGWTSGTQDGTYRHKYQLWGSFFDNENTRLTFIKDGKEESFVPEQDYFYTSIHKTAQPQILDGEIVFLGALPESGLEENALKNKWVVVYDSNQEPEIQRAILSRAGAKGIIVVPGPDSTEFRYERKLHSLMENYRVDPHQQNGCQDNGCKKVIDEIMLTPKAASRLLSILATPASLFRPKKPAFPGLTLLHNNAAVSNSVKIKDSRVPLDNPFMAQAENVAAFWQGSDPELSKEVIVLTAHYDHLGTKNGTIYNGADDNGSGTVGLLALAEAIAKLNPKRSIMLLWVSGEEKGLLGSEAWVKDYQKNPWLPNGGKLVANINMDMISRNDPKQFSLTPSPRHRRYNVISKTATELAELEGFTKVNSGDRYYSRSDQYNFAEILGIPVAFLTVDEHEDYHRSTDDPEKSDYDKIRRITRMFVRVIDALDGVGVIK